MQTMTGTQIEQLAADVATPAQLAALAKMSKMGWKVTKVVGSRGKADVGMSCKTQGAWLHADGTLTRPKVGCKSATLAR